MAFPNVWYVRSRRVSEGEGERERVCVCVCERERERERESQRQTDKQTVKWADRERARDR